MELPRRGALGLPLGSRQVPADRHHGGNLVDHLWGATGISPEGGRGRDEVAVVRLERQTAGPSQAGRILSRNSRNICEPSHRHTCQASWHVKMRPLNSSTCWGRPRVPGEGHCAYCKDGTCHTGLELPHYRQLSGPKGNEGAANRSEHS
ncbi:MAG: hypothetical protein AAF485_13760 [Chloroflexota bacterium]